MPIDCGSLWQWYPPPPHACGQSPRPRDGGRQGASGRGLYPSAIETPGGPFPSGRSGFVHPLDPRHHPLEGLYTVVVTVATPCPSDHVTTETCGGEGGTGHRMPP